MAERSKRICMYDAEKIKNINPETLKLFQKYQVDMSIRDLSPNTITGYVSDLYQWFIYMIISSILVCLKLQTMT